MSILNLGLQSVGIARQAMEEKMELAISNYNSVSEIRRVAQEDVSLKEVLLDSVASAKTTLSSVTQRLKLKDKAFTVDVAAQEAEISQLWSSLKRIDDDFLIGHTEKVSLKTITLKLKAFMSHCCCQRHYFFEIRKCGEPTRELCTPIRMPLDKFAQIKRFPDPVLNTATADPATYTYTLYTFTYIYIQYAPNKVVILFPFNHRSTV